MELQDVPVEAQRIATEASEECNRALERYDYREAKRVLTAANGALRNLKAEVTAAERDERADFTEARQKMNSTGQVIGAMSSAKTRGKMARGRAMGKRDLAKKQQEVTERYRIVKAFIDDLTRQIDAGKRDIDNAAAEAKSEGAAATPASAAPSTSAPPPPPPPTPAQWAADPSGRHQLRYWDGTTWTEHVSDGGEQATDPMT